MGFNPFEPNWLTLYKVQRKTCKLTLNSWILATYTDEYGDFHERVHYLNNTAHFPESYNIPTKIGLHYFDNDCGPEDVTPQQLEIILKKKHIA